MALQEISDREVAVLQEINQRTLVGGTEVDTRLIAEQLGVSPSELSASLQKLLAAGSITATETNSSITPDGHAFLA